VTYPIAVTGGSAGWADDEIDLGPLSLGQEGRFTLCCGGAKHPEFRVRIKCREGDDCWELVELLPPPGRLTHRRGRLTALRRLLRHL